MEELIIAIDIGGTTIKLGFVDIEGTIIKKWEIKTNIKNNGETIVDDIWESLEDQSAKMDLELNNFLGIGIGVPGFVDNINGVVYQVVNIGWKNYPLKDEFKKKTFLPVFIENDANLAAIGENWLGSGNNSRNLIMVTLGTGVGGASIANGEILNGIKGAAGEIGHVKVNKNGFKCNCGNTGCLDTIASADGIVQAVKKQIKENPEKVSPELKNIEKNLNSKDIFTLAKNGDTLCLSVIENAMDYLAMGIGFMASVINPSKIIVGGGLSKAGDFLLNIIKKSFDSYVLESIKEGVEIELALLSNDAGIIGATSIVLQNNNFESGLSDPFDFFTNLPFLDN